MVHMVYTLGPKGVPICLLEGPSIYHIATWTLWEALNASLIIACTWGFALVLVDLLAVGGLGFRV